MIFCLVSALGHSQVVSDAALKAYIDTYIVPAGELTASEHNVFATNIINSKINRDSLAILETDPNFTADVRDSVQAVLDDDVTITGNLTTTGDLLIGKTAGYDTITANTITAEAVTIDWRKSNIQTLALSDTVTVTFTAPPNYCHLTLKIVHANNTTVFPVTWPATVKWAGGTAVTPTATANAVDIVSFLYDGTNYYGMFGNDFK